MDLTNMSKELERLRVVTENVHTGKDLIAWCNQNPRDAARFITLLLNVDDILYGLMEEALKRKTE